MLVGDPCLKFPEGANDRCEPRKRCRALSTILPQCVVHTLFYKVPCIQSRGVRQCSKLVCRC